MKRNWIALGFVVLAVCLSVSLHASKPDPKGTETGKAGGFAWDALEATAAPNCTWTCGDGRTGSAEVNTEAQCAAACSGACGGPCGPAREEELAF